MSASFATGPTPPVGGRPSRNMIIVGVILFVIFTVFCLWQSGIFQGSTPDSSKNLITTCPTGYSFNYKNSKGSRCEKTQMPAGLQPVPGPKTVPEKLSPKPSSPSIPRTQHSPNYKVSDQVKPRSKYTRKPEHSSGVAASPITKVYSPSTCLPTGSPSLAAGADCCSKKGVDSKGNCM